MLKETSTFYNIKLAVDVFNDCLKKEQKKHMERLDFVAKNYNGSLRDHERSKENERYKSALDKLKTDCREQTAQDLGNIRLRIESTVKQPQNPEKLNFLRSLDSMPLSQQELDIISERLKDNPNYFEMKQLSQLAKNHGLKLNRPFADITAQIQTLDAMDESIRTYLYGGDHVFHADKKTDLVRNIPPAEEAENSYESKLLLSNRQFDMWENRFNGGYEGATAAGQAREYVSILHNNRTPSENAQIIDNMLETEKSEPVKHEFMRQVVNDPALSLFIPYTKNPGVFDAVKEQPKDHTGESLTDRARRLAKEEADEKSAYEAKVAEKAQDKKPSAWEQKVDNTFAEASGLA